MSRKQRTAAHVPRQARFHHAAAARPYARPVDRDQWQARYSTPDRVWSGEPNPWLVEFAKALPPASALDLACGEGADAVWLARRGWDVTAVDFAPAALDRTRTGARQAGVETHMHTIGADLASWQPRDGFDLVSVGFFHAEPSLRARVHRMAWAATRGTLVIVGHDPRNHTEGHGGPPDPTKLYSPDDVLQSLGLARGDAQVVCAETRASHSDDPDRIAWDSVVVLRRCATPDGAPVLGR